MAALRRWREKPAEMVDRLWGVTPYDWQLPVLEIFPSQDPDKVRIAMQGASGPGKTALMAWLGWNFLLCYGEIGEHPNAAAVAITGENLQAHLWKELAKWRVRTRPGVRDRALLDQIFEQTGRRIYARDHERTWFMDARSFPKRTERDTLGATLAGLHSAFVLYLIDESGAIAVEIMNAAEQGYSSARWFKVIQSGNPLTMDGMLYAAATRLRPHWHFVEIPGDPDDPRCTHRSEKDRAWARSQIALRGREDPWVKVYILNKFPDKPFNALFSHEELEAAMRRSPHPDQVRGFAKLIGADVGREGDDPSVIAKRQGRVIYPLDVFYNVDGPWGAGYVSNLWKEWDADAAFIDNTGGFGGSWVDHLRLLQREPVPVHFAGAAADPRFFNKRAEMLLKFARWVKEGGSLPYDPELIREGTAIQYYFHGDKLAVEDKDQIKARLKHSTNRCDACGLTFAEEVPPRDLGLGWGTPQRGAPGIVNVEIAE